MAVGGFTVASARFGWGMQEIFAQAAKPGLLMCANSVTDPLSAILGLGTPIAVSGVVCLACLAHPSFASRASVASAAVLALGCTAALLHFGFRFFREALPGFHLSQIVWWLRPFGV
jgi:hypothetical protein